MPLTIDKSEFTPQGLVVTARTLRNWAHSDIEKSEHLDRAEKLLTDAQNDLFIPFLRQTETTLLPFEFERLAYLYFPYRVHVVALMLQALGPSTFGMRYLAMMSKLTESFSEKATLWNLDAGIVKQSFVRYLSSMVRILGFAKANPTPEPEQLADLLKAVTKVDFGLTALFLVFEDSVSADKRVVAETFRLTADAVQTYEKSVNRVLQDRGPSSLVAGSLKLEGNIDEAFGEFNSAWRAFLGKYMQR